MTNTHSEFREVIRTTRLEPPQVIVPGKLHRFPGIGKRPDNRSGWCLFFHDEQGGCFGDWSSGLSEVWHVKRHRPYSPRERSEFRRRVEETRKKATAERLASQADAAQRATGIWSRATAAPDNHPYLLRKCIKVHGAKMHEGSLVLPVTDFDGALTSLQFIDVEGTKRLLSGGRKQGCFIHVGGDIAGASKIVICEGWATGCTLAEDRPAALVLAAIDSGNMESVAVAARLRWPHEELVIAGDDDRLTSGNPGATKARAAAIAAGAELAFPQWPDDAPEEFSDFNDLAVWLKGDIS